MRKEKNIKIISLNFTNYYILLLHSAFSNQHFTPRQHDRSALHPHKSAFYPLPAAYAPTNTKAAVRLIIICFDNVEPY